MRAGFAALAVFSVSAANWAHAHEAVESPAFGAPALDLWLGAMLLATIIIYGIGVVRIRARSQGAMPWLRVGLFFAAWCSLVLALIGPLPWFAAQTFTAHMVEHEILMTISAPLFVVSRPQAALMWGVSPGIRRFAGAMITAIPGRRSLATPAFATVIHAIAIWIWHRPEFFTAAWTDPVLHAVQHAIFFGTALMFWFAMLPGSYGAQRAGAAVFWLFLTAMHTGFLGILLTVARAPWYPDLPLGRDVSPLEDQQLAGLVMWIPGGVVYLAAALVLAGLWITRSGAGSKEAAHAPLHI